MDPNVGLTSEDSRAVERAIEFIRESPAPIPEYRWLFILAGFLRGSRPGVRPSDLRAVASATPAALEFAKRIASLRHSTEEYIDWSDTDAVVLEFQAAWLRRKHVQGGDFLDRAVELSRHNLLRLPAEVNGWVVRIATMGFILQELQPDLPFLIPVNENTARKLGTSLRTLSLAVNGAVAAKYLQVEVKAGEHGGGRFARRLRFNYRSPRIRPLLREAKADLEVKLAQAPQTALNDKDEFDPFADD